MSPAWPSRDNLEVSEDVKNITTSILMSGGREEGADLTNAYPGLLA